MSENRVDLGNVKGDRGFTGVGINNVILYDYDEVNCLKTYRMYYSDSTAETPHYTEFTLTDNEAIRRVNDISNVSSSADYKNVPTIALLKQVIASVPKNTEVYRKEQVYTKSEVESLIANADIIDVVTALPTGNNIKAHHLYLLKKNTDSSDSLNQTFDLYTYDDNDWIKLDNLTFNISNYVTSTELSTQLSGKQDANISNNMTSDASSTTKYPSVNAIKTYVDNKATTDLANYYTKSQIDSMIADIQDFIHS